MTRRTLGLGFGRWMGVALLALGLAMPAAAQTKAKTPAPVKATTSAPAKATAPAKAAQPDITDLKSLGSKSAPIKMEVFSDFQCPACRDLYFQTVRPMIDNYVSAGKVYLVHRDMPLPIHPHSREAARYANAAARVKKMEKVVLALFDNQAKWATDGNIDGVVATALTKAEMVQVRKMASGTSLDAGIDKDVALGNQFRVTQTPTTIITYKGQTYPVVGVVTYKMLTTFLDGLLKQ